MFSAAAGAAALSALALVQGTPHADRLAADDGKPQIVRCFGGVDLVTADRLDRVASDCETVVRRVLVDPLRIAGSQHETVVEPDSAASGATVVAVAQVGRREAGGADRIGFAVSADGGRAWRTGLLPAVIGDAGFVSDPVVAHDGVHGTWLAATLFGAAGVGSGLYVSRSPDGFSWAPPVTAAVSPARDLAFDKQWLACDDSLGSAFRGRCYLAYTAVTSNALAVVHSDDGGATWSAPVPASPSAHDELTGAQPAVLPDGTLVVAYMGDDAIRSTVSHDGGTTFVDATVSPAQGGPLRFRPARLTIPSMEIGGDGRLRAVWADCSLHPGCLVNDVVLSSSADGLAWTPPVRVPAVPAARSAFIPALAADPGGSRVAVVAYGSSGSVLDAYVVRSRDGGVTWTAPQRLSSRSIPDGWVAQAGQAFVGDYVSAEFAGNRLVPTIVLAAPPTGRLLHESLYATSIVSPS